MSNHTTSFILKTLQSILPTNKKQGFLPLHEPYLSGNTLKYVKDCVESGWVSYLGSYVDKFENQLAEYVGTKHAVVVTSGTSALHLALKVCDVKDGDEVLIPALSFVATANSVSYCNATPHFIDIAENTLGIDSKKLDNYLSKSTENKNGFCINSKTRKKISAIIAMHCFGHPVDMNPLVEVAKKYNIQIIEDGAQSLGSKYKGKNLGTYGKISTLSFNGNKIITTGGGGALLTNDNSLAKHAKHLSTVAKSSKGVGYFHDEIGYNYRMPNINAALGCAQLEQLPYFLEKKRNLANRYKEAFVNIKGVKFFSECDFAESNYWLNTLILDNPNDASNLIKITNDVGIMTRPAWTLIPDLPMYKDCPSADLSTARNLCSRIVNIPSSVVLGESE